MWNDTARRSPAALQREVLSGGDAVYPLRSRDRVHVPMGGGLQRGDRAERPDLVEHAQLHHHPDGGLRLRAQKRRARLQGIARWISEFEFDLRFLTSGFRW